jgi:hypothetical protein
MSQALADSAMRAPRQQGPVFVSTRAWSGQAPQQACIRRLNSILGSAMSTDTPRMIPVMSGRVCAVFMLSTARGVAAYDRNEQSLGEFADVMAAAVAVEKSVNLGTANDHG